MVGDAALDGGPWGWDASMYCAEHLAGEDWLLAGDAASFIDPLSSAGVKKAMASGWLAAVTVNTSLADASRARGWPWRSTPPARLTPMPSSWP